MRKKRAGGSSAILTFRRFSRVKVIGRAEARKGTPGGKGKNSARKELLPRRIPKQ